VPHARARHRPALDTAQTGRPLGAGSRISVGASWLSWPPGPRAAPRTRGISEAPGASVQVCPAGEALLGHPWWHVPYWRPRHREGGATAGSPGSQQEIAGGSRTREPPGTRDRSRVLRQHERGGENLCALSLTSQWSRTGSSSSRFRTMSSASSRQAAERSAAPRRSWHPSVSPPVAGEQPASRPPPPVLSGNGDCYG
jgi:hypothetical protein